MSIYLEDVKSKATATVFKLFGKITIIFLSSTDHYNFYIVCSYVVEDKMAGTSQLHFIDGDAC